MPDAELRRQRRRAENASRSRPITQVATIGQRSNNGRYNVISPDGGLSIGKAEKIYSAKHDEGDTVIALPRRDGVILLEGPKATTEPTAKDNPLALAALVDNCDGYINGQVFNCGVDKRVTTIAWAIGRQGQFYSLVNLITGETFGLASVPATVPPCATPPSNFPPPLPVPPALPPDSPWYQHVWNIISWGTPSPRCFGAAPVHPNTLTGISSSTIELQSAIDGTSWTYRASTGAYLNEFGNFVGWSSNSLVTYSQDPTPPAIATGATDFAVISNAFNYSGFAGSYLQIGTLGWTYVSGGCPTSATYNPPPPIDSRNPSGTPIANTVEATVSIGADFSPIGLIRHTPNCVSAGVWNYEKSFRIEGTQTKTYSGKLDTDWRYGPTFTCRDTFDDEKFVNISPSDRAKLWSVETADRPATLTPGTPTQITVTEKTIEPNCATTIVKTKEITAISTGNLPFDILGIAVLIQKR
jgi:hypothetical protein